MINLLNIKIEALSTELETIYIDKNKALPFHGWHHIQFVRAKAIEFAKSLKCNLFIVESAALTHDLNYIVAKNSQPEIGIYLRRELLTKCNYDEDEIQRIEQIILEAHTEYRADNISDEAKALSDADTLFKALPITPILFAHKYISENGVTLAKLAEKVIAEQKPLMEKDIYFYTNLAKERYTKWAKTNLDLWANVIEAIQNDDILELMMTTGWGIEEGKII